MKMQITRREFIDRTAQLGAIGFMSALGPVRAEEAKLDPAAVRFSPGIEPLVRFIEDTPRERLLEEMGARIRGGLAYRDVLAALLLAGVRNIQPRPVGFKFHSVLVVNSAHLASIASPDSDRWLPVFWALDYFKNAQKQDVEEGNWTMSPPKESEIPSAGSARKAFVEAMDNWDESAADAAVVGLVRSAGANEIFDLLCRYGARDFRDIGHKAIYVANSWRTLQVIGWQHAEPVLRSLAYALLDRGGSQNPAKADLSPDRPWRRNQPLAAGMSEDWRAGKISNDSATSLLTTLRQGSDSDASESVAKLLNEGVAPQSIWDALFNSAGEQLMRNPGIIALHAVTTTNAMHFAWRQCGHDETRRMLLLQNAAFLPLFRGGPTAKGTRIDELEPQPLEKSADAMDEIFSDVSGNRPTAARKVLGWLKDNAKPDDFINTARRLIFLKGTNAHDYKFSSAVLEDYAHLTPPWRERLLASSVFSLRGSGAPDNELVKRTRGALAG